MKETTIDSCKVMPLPVIQNRAGNITAPTNNIDIPFEVRRLFYIYDIPAGKDRGAHAHISCHQFLIATSGSFDVELTDGKRTLVFKLNRPFNGLYIPPGIWGAEKNFSSGSICLVLTSSLYEENDYIRNYDDFLKYKHGSL